MDSNSMTPPLTSFLCAWQRAEGMDDLGGIKAFDKQLRRCDALLDMIEIYCSNL